ncbi:MAG: hypothetical protein HeimC2_26500 [Candidatus Heimdallarchaeota archaeon LC_2]|nr:MAG: hypothetical protein HeimC2_26500 [Candidatus Heimdallarchaeota archaeon LC_2]
MNSKYIAGINPSIAKLVYLLNFWGAKTYESHASFYPSDTEEQEYWVQKKGIEDRLQIDIQGPILIWGTIFRLPSIYILLNKNDIDKFMDILPEKWLLSGPSGHLNKDTKHVKSCKLEYRHPKLLGFKQIWNDLWLDALDEFDLTEETLDTIYQNNLWPKLNEYLISKLPLTQTEFNEIRNQGIKQLEESLLQSITNFDNHRFKHLADKFIINLNLREDYDLSYFRDITE